MPDDETNAPSEAQPGLIRALDFPLFDALTGRRSRRFAAGLEIPGGPFAFRSELPPQPLTELETVTVLAAMAGSTGWHFMHPHSSRADPALPAYSIRPGGRTMASGAGWHTTELFFTDDTGTFLFETRDAGALVTPDASGRIEPIGWIEAHRARICPPHLPSMTAAVERLHARRHAAGGAFDPDTGGPWRDSATVRRAGAVPGDRARACLAAMAETIHARYGRFPASLPSIHVSLYLQAHHLDLGFYDRFFAPGAVLSTHRDHQRDWH
jgi:hypothetical protein